MSEGVLREFHVNGCDDSTIFEMELSLKEFEIIKKFSTLCNKASEYLCQPTIEIIGLEYDEEEESFVIPLPKKPSSYEEIWG